MPYHITHTTPADWPQIQALLHEAMNFTKKNNYPIYPGHDRHIYEKDMQEKRHFKIVDDDHIACIFSICYSDPTIWAQREKGDALYLHRVVTNPLHKGQRLFQLIVDWSTAHIKEKQLKYLRLDTWSDNEKIIRYYESFGFRQVEKITTPDTEDLPPSHRNLNLVLLEKN